MRLQIEAAGKRHAPAAVVQLANVRPGRALHFQQASNVAQNITLHLQGLYAKLAATVVQTVAGAELQLS
ncbi:hypothetical protein [Stenotrophomonas ginsengisoli]|uniref:hypothetical protein n=1 Tax=Stenotrophomonas ginsengisoli TaxID=336566 RepID=UPI001FDF7B12|nr:hypothetical protein [Stenotrophomonas ginsengisoli]